jgi:peptidoglycan/LPS O-acetylase OafA/YrhL
MFMIPIFLPKMKATFPNTPFWAIQIIQYLAILFVSMGVGALSWQTFEKQFLKLKRYFEYASNKDIIARQESNASIGAQI